ncbi:MAG: nitrate reductase associated protein [Bacteroidetes bacterium]|nr:nitrate reductase associated protein [Bacteroidota bacterium]
MNSVTDNLKVKIEYFNFEQDFMEDNIRCIPMIARFKLDGCGIKLKLKEWNKMTVEERENLANFSTDSVDELNAYREYLEKLILQYTKEKPTYLADDQRNTLWSMTDRLPSQLQEKLSELKMNISTGQWKNLSVLQRYALLKLTRPGHENRNFPKAMKEFGLIS